MTAVDPETGGAVSLFNPRMQRWQEHFRWNGLHVEGLTATGRATINALQLNRPSILAIRVEEAERGRQ